MAIVVFFESFSEWLAVRLAVILTWAENLLFHLLLINPSQVLYSYVVSTSLHRAENSIGFRDGGIREDPQSHR